MADGHDRYDSDNNGGGSFVMGLLTGTVLGAGLGMLFAPRAGSDLRNQLAEQAGTLATNAQDGYRRASETAQRASETAQDTIRRASETAGELAGKGKQIADKGREFVDRAKDAASKGAEEASRYARETAATVTTPDSKRS